MVKVSSGTRVQLPGPDDVTRHVLPNGLVILVRENWAGPAVVARGLLRIGRADEPFGRDGLAQFTASLLTCGTTTRSFADIAESVESVGATFGVGSGLLLGSLGGKALHDDFPMLLDILADVLQLPSFPTDHLERIRGQMLNAMRQHHTDTGAVANETFFRLVYPPNHPLAAPDGGTRESLTAISRDDIIQFYTDYYTPAGGILAIVGAVHTEEAIDLVTRTLGDWWGSQQAIANATRRFTLPDAISLETPSRETVTLDGKSQSDLVLGHHGLARRDPDYLPMLLMNGILGQMGLGGRLGVAVREQAGLAYSVSSRFFANLAAGPWLATASVNPRHVERAVDLILTEVRRIRETPVDAEELADIKARETGSLPLDMETNGGVAGELVSMELHSLGLDYLHHLPGLIEAVTIDDIQAVAQRRLDPDRYALAVAGPETRD